MLFDDYAEGTHVAMITPTTSGSVTLNSNLNTLSYTKNGRDISVKGNLLVSSVISPVGAFDISLPLANASLAEESPRTPAKIVVYSVVSANATDFLAILEPGSSSLRVYLGNSTTLQSTSANQLQSGSQINIEVAYSAS